jgi:DNA end-binding protein Ku
LALADAEVGPPTRHLQKRNRFLLRLTVAGMPRAMWKGAISFGLVTIPVALHNATRSEELKFRMLRKKDLSPINYKRVAEVDGKEVPWDEIVKGYEYEKGKFVVLNEEDFKRVDVEATESIDIIDFVPLDEINPIYFHRPYYLEPAKGGAGAYGLLRDVLAKAGKAGIAKVVIRTRQHLAAVKANDKMLVLDLMYFADELVSTEHFKVPAAKLGKRELDMAEMLVKQMSAHWEPEKYNDDYRSALMKLIDQKVEAGGKELPGEKPKHKAATNVIDLVSVLKKSLEEAGKGAADAAKKSKKAATKRRPHHRKAA